MSKNVTGLQDKEEAALTYLVWKLTGVAVSFYEYSASRLYQSSKVMPNTPGDESSTSEFFYCFASNRPQRFQVMPNVLGDESSASEFFYWYANNRPQWFDNKAEAAATFCEVYLERKGVNSTLPVIL